MSYDIKYEEAPKDIYPICPHCKEVLSKIWIKKKGMGIIEQKQVLLCPHCKAFLGYGSVNFT